MGSIIEKNQRSTISCYCTFNPCSTRARYELERIMVVDSSVSGGGWQQDNASYLITIPYATGRSYATPLISHLLPHIDLYHRCMDNSGWARVLFDAHGGMEKLTFLRKLPPAVSVAAPAEPSPCQPGCFVSKRRHAPDRRKWEAWATRRRNSSRPFPLPPANAEDGSAMAAGTATSPELSLVIPCHRRYHACNNNLTNIYTTTTPAAPLADMRGGQICNRQTWMYRTNVK
jgi:hypothetical protein